MKTIKRFIIPSCISILLVIAPGCAGYVSGDLSNTRHDIRLPSCTNACVIYQIKYRSGAEDDDGSKNIAGYLSTFTFGIIPTYWRSTVLSEATVFQNGTAIFEKKYESKIDSFYGILWAFILPSTGINTLQSDEGGGIRIQWGIQDRTIAKIISDHGGNTNQYCFIKK